MMEVGRLLLKKPTLDGCQRHRSTDKLLRRLLDGDRRSCRRQFNYRLVLKELPRTDLPSVLHGQSDDFDTQNGVSTQREKVIMDAYILQAKHLLPDRGEHPFGRR